MSRTTKHAITVPDFRQRLLARLLLEWPLRHAVSFLSFCVFSDCKHVDLKLPLLWKALCCRSAFFCFVVHSVVEEFVQSVAVASYVPVPPVMKETVVGVPEACILKDFRGVVVDSSQKRICGRTGEKIVDVPSGRERNP